MAAPGLTRRRLLGLAAAGLAAGTSGCARPGSGPDRSGRARVIGLSTPDDGAYALGVASGVARALQGSGYGLRLAQARGAAAAEPANVQRFLDARVAGIVVLPVAVGTATRSAQVAQQAGVPVANVLSPGPGPGDRFFAGTVDTGSPEAGRMLARAVRARRPDGAGVVVVQGTLGRGVSEVIDRGLDEVLAPGGRFGVLLRGPANDDPAQAVALVREALAAHPDLGAVVTYGAAMASGVAGLLAGRPEVVHVAGGADERLLGRIGTPGLAAARYVSPARTGLEAGRLVLDALEGGDAQADPFTRTVAQRMLDRPGPPPGDPPVYAAEARGLRFEAPAPPQGAVPLQEAPSSTEGQGGTTDNDP